LANSPQVGLTLDAGEGAAAGRFSGNVGLPVHRVSQEASGVVHIAASGRIILTRGTSSVTLQSPTARLTGATGLLVFRALGGPTVRFDLEVKARTPIPRGTRLSVWARVQENAASFLGNRLGIPLQAGDLAAVLTVTIPR
jgi:hypothetical protein